MSKDSIDVADGIKEVAKQQHLSHRAAGKAGVMKRLPHAPKPALTGHGTALIGVCSSGATRPGTPPSTKSLQEISHGNAASGCAKKLQAAVMQRSPPAEIKISTDFQNFGLKPGLTVVGTCGQSHCKHFQTQMQNHCGSGSFDMVASFFPCRGCHKGLKKDSLHFDSCDWKVKWAYSDDIGDVHEEERSEGAVFYLDRPSYEALKVDAKLTYTFSGETEKGDAYHSIKGQQFNAPTGTQTSWPCNNLRAWCSQAENKFVSL